MSTANETMDRVVWSDDPEDVYLKQLVMERRREQYGSQAGDSSIAGDSLMKDIIAYQQHAASDQSIRDGYFVHHSNYDSDMREDQQMSTMSDYASTQYQSAGDDFQSVPTDPNNLDAGSGKQSWIVDPVEEKPGRFSFPPDSSAMRHFSPPRNRNDGDIDNNTLSTKDGIFDDTPKDELEGWNTFLRHSLSNPTVRRLLYASLCMFCIFLVVIMFAVYLLVTEDGSDTGSSSSSSSSNNDVFPRNPDGSPRGFLTLPPTVIPDRDVKTPTINIDGNDTKTPANVLDDVTQAPTYPSPTDAVINQPSEVPTRAATDRPTSVPTVSPPSSPPSQSLVTDQPTWPDVTNSPTLVPSSSPTSIPTPPSSAVPSTSPSTPPSDAPTSAPSSLPSVPPTTAPSMPPTTKQGLAELRDIILTASPLSAEALADPQSPQSRAAVWLLEDPSFNTYSNERLLQRWSMATFYNSLNGDVWRQSSGWMSYTDECSWFSRRRICNDLNQVQQLDLRSNSLDGTLPPEIALLSSSLSRLFLNENRGLRGTVPLALTQMTMLTNLRLTITSMSGTIPTEIGLLTNLGTIGLGRGNFIGTVPTEIGRLTDLDSLGFEGNDLTGTIPTEIGLTGRNRAISLKGNRLSGRVPSQLGQLTQLESLQLDDNDLTGTMPNQICFQPGRVIEKIVVDCDEVKCGCCDECRTDAPTRRPTPRPVPEPAPGPPALEPAPGPPAPPSISPIAV